MRNSFTIKSVENITSKYILVDRSQVTDSKHILDGNLVYQVTFVVGYDWESERVNRTYVANVELRNCGDHYCSCLRCIKTPRDFERMDTTKPMRWLSPRELKGLRDTFKIDVKFAKGLQKATECTVFPWS